MPSAKVAGTIVVLMFIIVSLPLKTRWLSSFSIALPEFSTFAFAQDKDQDKTQEKKEKQTAPAKDEKGGKEKALPVKAEKPCPECPDCSKLVLEGLEDKKAEIARAEERLNQERKRLDKFKQEIDEKLGNLTALKEQIDKGLLGMEGKKSEKEMEQQKVFDAKMGRLVKMYSGMKPKKAAAIFDKMDIEVAKQIFSLMRESSASEILAFMESEKAAKISERIAFKKK